MPARMGLLFCAIIIHTFKMRRVEYRYNLVVEGYQFSSKLVLEWGRPWTAECAYSDRALTEWGIWDAIDRELWAIRTENGHLPDISLKVRVTRKRKVLDWCFSFFIIHPIEVPEDDYHITDVFETEDDFMLAIPDLDCDLELPRREWHEPARDWLLGDPPTPLSSPPRTPSLPQGRFLRPVRIVDPDDPDWEGEDEHML
ncbi:hypothetical protein FRC06_011508 [Ceratobasidium sp. 370]|nr:hypothetical protein FRC06_011508 [Ceratobasidium sp. 370]